jgi:hypothetical protein
VIASDEEVLLFFVIKRPAKSVNLIGILYAVDAKEIKKLLISILKG